MYEQNDYKKGGGIQPANAKTTPARSPGEEVLRGAAQIAEFVLGDRNERRSIYYLVEKAQLPVFRLGVVICARKSTLLEWIEQQEKAVAA